MLSERDGVLGETLAYGHTMHSHLRDAVEVDERRGDHQHVEYLVALEPNITPAGEKPLWHSPSVEDGSDDVETAHEYEPAQRCVRDGIDPALGYGIMDRRDYAAETKHRKYSCSNRPEGGFTEAIPQWDNHGAET